MTYVKIRTFLDWFLYYSKKTRQNSERRKSVTFSSSRKICFRLEPIGIKVKKLSDVMTPKKRKQYVRVQKIVQDKVV